MKVLRASSYELLRKIVKYDPQLAHSGDLMVEETEQSLKFPMTGQWTWGHFLPCHSPLSLTAPLGSLCCTAQRETRGAELMIFMFLLASWLIKGIHKDLVKNIE